MPEDVIEGKCAAAAPAAAVPAPEAPAPRWPPDARAALGEIGARLRAFRMGRGIPPEELAERIGISRAALYRTEKGQIAKIETLARIAAVLGVSLPTLLGVEVEYIDSAITFFERMRQLEDQADAVTGLFGPVSYLLTSGHYDGMLREVLLDTLPGEPAEAEGVRGRIDTLMGVLAQRKAHFARHRPRITSLISSADMERFLLHGLLGRHDLPAETVARRRRQARGEALHVAALARTPPSGVQIGVMLHSMPAMTFQIFDQAARSVLAISPFRLGEQPNVSLGVAVITSADEPIRLHQAIAGRLWGDALKGDDAARHLEALVARYAIA